jgi:asparagine synthase (glutamine-hydrolysing)
MRAKLGVPSSGARLLSRFAGLCDALLPIDYLDRHELGFCFSTKHALLMFEMFLETFLVHRGNPAEVGTARDFLLSRADPARARALAASGLEGLTA